MFQKRSLGILLAGTCAGAVNGMFGGGGGLVLVPLLGLLSDLREDEIFPASVSIILPVCLVSLMVTGFTQGLPWRQALPYLAGSAVGGILAGLFGGRIPSLWLHRGLGILILWGGIRYLW